MNLFSKSLLLVLAAVLFFGVAGVAATWAPDKPVEELKLRWAPAPSQFVDIEGLQVHLRDEGPRDDPVPVVLLHGTSASLHTWEGWVKALRGQRRVISLDLPGFGLTGPYAGKYAHTPYTAANDARFVLDVLDALKVQRFSIGGNSLGGEVAWRLAASVPQRVDRLLLVDSTGYAFDTAAVPMAWRVARLPVVGSLLEQLLPRPLVVSALVDVYADPRRITEPLVDRYFELTLRSGNRHALVERIRGIQLGDGQAQIATIKAPTLILWGGRDQLIAPAWAERFHRDIAGSSVVMLPALGHVPQEEDPAASVVPVRAFLGLSP
jgi:pimeloyl-ACP methyl ester carboxylesterase